MTGSNGQHGLKYTSRDGNTVWQLDDFLSRHPEPRDLPRPERDVLAALLRFCLEGLDYLDVREKHLILSAPTESPS